MTCRNSTSPKKAHLNNLAGALLAALLAGGVMLPACGNGDDNTAANGGMGGKSAAGSAGSAGSAKGGGVASGGKGGSAGTAGAGGSSGSGSSGGSGGSPMSGGVGGALAAGAGGEEGPGGAAGAPAGGPDSTCAARHHGALITFEVATETFSVWITNAAFITEAKRLLLASEARIPVFNKLLDGRDCDTQWSWHPDPSVAVFADASAEVCDGRPSDIENSKNYWLGIGYCPWGAKVTAVHEQP